MSYNRSQKTVFKVVLTGGPCGGKTTGQDRLASFFESMGWRVFRVPETSTLLQKGGIRFNDLTEEEQFNFQEDILVTMQQIESVYFHLADTSSKDTLVICDRGNMDKEGWERILESNQLNPVDIRDNRYNQIVHMRTAAKGAETFYTLANNATRFESVDQAIARDRKIQQAWVGHPYFDVVDNEDTQTFEDKIRKLIQVVCNRAGVKTGDRLNRAAKKRKFLVSAIKADESFPPYQEFNVIHDYLHTSVPGEQCRLRKRGQHGKYNYTHTTRRHIGDEEVETRKQITSRDYDLLGTHKDERRVTTVKKRRSFMFNDRYYQLDVYQHPLPPRSPSKDSLMILETYTTFHEEFTPDMFPDCITVSKEITKDKAYSMYNLSLCRDATPGAIGSKAPAQFTFNLSNPEEIIKHTAKTNGKEKGHCQPNSLSRNGSQSSANGTGNGISSGNG